MSYPDSVRYLYSLGNELKAGAKFGLERMLNLLSALGNPERGQRFIHVAGTNGKGSTAAMIASILEQAGYRTGLYTSPHLIEPTERIRIGGADVDADEFAAAFQTVHEIAEKLVEGGNTDAHPSYFETVTAMAFLIFRSRRADVSVIEVGLGGRLDATNVIAPELCVITPVSYDHEAFLGNSLESIAAEKAGILKPRVPVILARQESVAAAVIEQRALELGCEISRASDAPLSAVHLDAQGSGFELGGVTYECPLRGKHQVENARTAILAAKQLNISAAAIQQGLCKTCWPGRLERMACNPDFLLDGAHNPAGATALADYIREFCTGRPVWLVYGAMRDKAVEEVTGQLFPLADHVILTAPDFPRALRPQAILELTGHRNYALTGTVAEALALAREAPAEALVFFTGSLYLVGEVRKMLLSSAAAVS